MTQDCEARIESFPASTFRDDFGVEIDGRTTPCTVVGQVLSQPLRGLAAGLQVLADLSGTVGPHTKSASTESEASSPATHRCSLSIHATRAAMDEDGQFAPAGSSRSASAGGSSKLVTGSLRQYPCGAFVKLELRHCQLTTLVFSQPAPAAAAPPQASTAAAATGPDAAGATTAAEALATMSAAGPADAGSVATLEAVVGDGGGRIAPTTAAVSSGPCRRSFAGCAQRVFRLPRRWVDTTANCVAS